MVVRLRVVAADEEVGAGLGEDEGAEPCDEAVVASVTGDRGAGAGAAVWPGEG